MIVILLPGFAGNLTVQKATAKSFASVTDPPVPSEEEIRTKRDKLMVPGAELVPLPERNAIYVECLKLASMCTSRLNALQQEKQNEVSLVYAGTFYREALKLFSQASQGLTPAVVVEAIQTIAEGIRRDPDFRAPSGFFFEHFAVSFRMLVDIASGDPKRLRPIIPQTPATEVPT